MDIYQINQETIEIQITGATTIRQWFFPDNENLRGVRTWHIESYYPEELTTSERGNALLTNAGCRNVYVKLVTETANGQSYQNLTLPLINFMHHYNGGVLPANPQPFVNQLASFQGTRIQWTKSFIQFNSAVGLPAAANESAVFTVHYTK